MEIVIGGDVFLGSVIEQVAINNPKEVWGNSIDIFKKSDFSIVNLECPLTVSEKKIEKTGPNIKANPETIRALKFANIDLVTLANNHILDYGEEGLKETLLKCKANEIDCVGADLDIKYSKSTYYKNIDNKKLAIINFAENEWSSANINSGGSNPMDIIDNVNQIKEAKANSDYVIIIIHGGHEHYRYPSPRMVKQYRFYAEHGATAIIGHHTHCVSGYEIHNGVPIFYSIGNLIFPSNTSNKYWYEGALLKLKLNEKISFDLLPYYQCKSNDVGIRLMNENDKKIFQDEIEKINKIIKKEDLLHREWNKFLKEEYKTRLKHLAGKRGLLYKIINKLNLLHYFISKRDMRLLLNLIRCEAHRDLSIDVLEYYDKKEK